MITLPIIGLFGEIADTIGLLVVIVGIENDLDIVVGAHEAVFNELEITAVILALSTDTSGSLSVESFVLTTGVVVKYGCGTDVKVYRRK